MTRFAAKTAGLRTAESNRGSEAHTTPMPDSLKIPNATVTMASGPKGGPGGDKLRALIHFGLATLLKHRLPIETDLEKKGVIKSACDELSVAAWAVEQGYATPQHKVMLRTAAVKGFKTAAEMITEINETGEDATVRRAVPSKTP